MDKAYKGKLGRMEDEPVRRMFVKQTGSRAACEGGAGFEAKARRNLEIKEMRAFSGSLDVAASGLACPAIGRSSPSRPSTWTLSAPHHYVECTPYLV